MYIALRYHTPQQDVHWDELLAVHHNPLTLGETVPVFLLRMELVAFHKKKNGTKSQNKHLRFWPETKHYSPHFYPTAFSQQILNCPGWCSVCSSTNITSFLPNFYLKLSKPTGHVMHQQFNIQQLYVLPTLYLCVLYLSENKQRLVPLTS